MSVSGIRLRGDGGAIGESLGDGFMDISTLGEELMDRVKIDCNDCNSDAVCEPMTDRFQEEVCLAE